MLFHLGVFDQPPARGGPARSRSGWPRSSPDPRPTFVAYLDRKSATCRPKTVSGLATRLSAFRPVPRRRRPGLDSLAGLDRRRHIEPYLASLVDAVNTKTGELITVADQARRVLAVTAFLTEITEWGWTDAPTRRLLFRSDIPRLPGRCRVTCPSTPTGDSPQRWSTSRQPARRRRAAAATLPAGCASANCSTSNSTACTRVPGHGSWLKVPLGKLDTERMVPLDDETVALIDRIAADPLGRPPAAAPAHRSARPVPVHPPRPPAVAERGARRTRPRPPRLPASATSPRTSSATPTPPHWSTPASRCRR